MRTSMRRAIELHTSAVAFAVALAACDSGVIVIDDVAEAPATVDSEPPSSPGDTDRPGPRPEDADPPVPAAPCGELDAHNGTVTPRVGKVGTPGDFVGDPAERGPLGWIERRGRVPSPTAGRGEVSLTAFLPSPDGETEAEGPFPLVVAMPGFGASHTNYRHLTTHLATHGFVVVGMDFPDTGFLSPARHDLLARDAQAVLAWALAEAPWAGRVDGTKVAAAGHSLGGKIAFSLAALDPRVDVVIGWDPQNSGGPPCDFDDWAPGDCNDFPVAPNCQADASGVLWKMRAESLVFGADDDLLTPDAHLRARHFYRGAPSPASWVHLPRASHAAWVTDGAESALSRRVHTALLLSRLRGYTGLDDLLPGGPRLDREPLVDDHRVK